MLHFIEKTASDDNHGNAQKSAAIAPMAKEQSQAMLKKQQPGSQEPFTNGSSPARTSRDDNGVEQNPTAMITDEISSATPLDDTDQSSVADDVTNVCKVIMSKPDRYFPDLPFEYEQRSVLWCRVDSFFAKHLRLFRALKLNSMIRFRTHCNTFFTRCIRNRASSNANSNCSREWLGEVSRRRIRLSVIFARPS